jgi:flagellar FliL protein
MKKKLVFVAPVLILLLAGAAYKLKFAPKPVPPKMKIEGTVVPMQKEFLVNLSGGRYAKVAVALIVDAAAGGGHGAGATEPAGLPQESAIRALITDQLTGVPGEDLLDRKSRHHILETIHEMIEKKTDEHVMQVLFTDITVQ